MAERYSVIEVYTREAARHSGKTLYEAVVDAVRAQEVGARCQVFRAIAGCFEDGRVAAHHIVDLSYDMPIKIEIILPSEAAGSVLPIIEELVTEGLVTMREVDKRKSS